MATSALTTEPTSTAARDVKAGDVGRMVVVGHYADWHAEVSGTLRKVEYVWEDHTTDMVVRSSELVGVTLHVGPWPIRMSADESVQFQDD